MRADSVAPRSPARLTIVIVLAPASASSTAIARAAPPAPRITTESPATCRIVVTDSRKPLPSVLSPTSSPSRMVTQLTAPIVCRGRAQPVEVLNDRDLVRNRAVEPLPLHCTGTAHGFSQVFRPDFHRQVTPWKAERSKCRLHHGLRRVLRHRKPKNASQFLFEGNRCGHLASRSSGKERRRARVSMIGAHHGHVQSPAKGHPNGTRIAAFTQSRMDFGGDD